MIATVNIIAGYIKADLIFFFTFSLFSNDSTIFNKKTSSLPLASPAFIKFTYTLSKCCGYFSKHLDKFTPPSKLFLISSIISFIPGFSIWSLSIAKTCKIGNPALTMVANCFENIRMSSIFTFFFLLKNEKLLDFFLVSAFFFFDFTMLVIIIFCSFNKWEASSRFIASMSPWTYLPSEIPL